MDVRNRKPLWGFGPIGWVAAAVLAALLIALARGWDLVHACAALIWRFSDGTIEGWVKIWVVVWCFPAAMMSGVTFGIWGLLYGAVAFFIYPRRLPRLPILLLVLTVAVEAFTLGLTPRSVQARIPVELPIVLATAAAAIEFGLILWLTRRWWCAAPFVIPLIWNAGVEPLMSSRGYPAWVDHKHVVLGTHAVIAVPLLLWAVVARAQPAPTGKPCSKCDYDLTGVASSACPECGAQISA